ncbi:putative rRNA maturation factor [Neochlamydia sp. EPS4]|nr:putative rRNA maturation factor [Neochlamydia sp. EPS4]
MHSLGLCVNKVAFNPLITFVQIHVYNKQKNLSFPLRLVKKIADAVIKLENQSCDELSIYFVTPLVISQLHQQYFNDPSTTDCISFPMDTNNQGEEPEKYRILGEIFVCPQTAFEYAKKHSGDPYEECTLYIVHGLLHLMGYEDTERKKKLIMRKAEKKHMVNLKKLNLLLLPK